MASIWNTTPNVQDVFSRYMVETFDQRRVVGISTGLQAFFGRPETGAITGYSPDKLISDIDIVKANTRTSALIRRELAQGNDLDLPEAQAGKHTSITRLFPLAFDRSMIDDEQILARLPGEDPYAAVDRYDRMRRLARGIIEELTRRMTRLFEYLCSQSLFEGTMPGILGTTNTDLIYDWLRNSDNIVTVSPAWDNSGDSLGNIDTGCLQIKKVAHRNPDMLILDGAAYDAFLMDTKVIALADVRGYVGMITAGRDLVLPSKFDKFVGPYGLIPQGRLKTKSGFELWIFTYPDFYTNSAGTIVPYVPSGYGLIACSDARCDRLFGPAVKTMSRRMIEEFSDIFGFGSDMGVTVPNATGASANHALVPEAFYHMANWANHARTAIEIRTQSAPLFVTTETDAFYTMKGLLQ